MTRPFRSDQLIDGHDPGCPAIADDESDYEYLADAGICVCPKSEREEASRSVAECKARLANEDAMRDTVPATETVCEKCGTRYGVGQSPFCRDNHDFVAGYHPFKPYFDVALGEEITSFAQRENVRRSLKAEFCDQPRAGDLSARKDKMHESQRERQR